MRPAPPPWHLTGPGRPGGRILRLPANRTEPMLPLLGVMLLLLPYLLVGGQRLPRAALPVQRAETSTPDTPTTRLRLLLLPATYQLELLPKEGPPTRLTLARPASALPRDAVTEAEIGGDVLPPAPALPKLVQALGRLVLSHPDVRRLEVAVHEAYPYDEVISILDGARSVLPNLSLGAL